MCHREASPGRLPSKNWPCHILLPYKHRPRWASPECTGPPRGRRPKKKEVRLLKGGCRAGGCRAFELRWVLAGCPATAAGLESGGGRCAPFLCLQPPTAGYQESVYGCFFRPPRHSRPGEPRAKVPERLSAGVLFGWGAGMCGQKTSEAVFRLPQGVAARAVLTPG